MADIHMTLNRRRFLIHSSLLAAASPLSCQVFAEARNGLKDAFKDRFLIGTAVNDALTRGDHADLTEIVKRNFSSITPENALKWERLRTNDGGWKWTDADNFVAFGQQHKIHSVGHCLAWHSQIPDSVFKTAKGSYIKPAQLRTKMTEHITTLVSRYKGKLADWDVVNEAVGDDNVMRKSHYFKILGEQFIDHAFNLAHEVDPNAHLLYNDYNIEKDGKREAALALLQRLKKRGVPIQGVGIQAHISIDGPSIADIEKSIEAYAKLGLRISFTELDIDVLSREWDSPTADIATKFDYTPERDPYIKGMTKERNEQLSARYESLFKLFIKHKDKIDRVTFWGISDDTTWLNDFPIKGRTNHPLLFDRTHQPKDVYFRLLQL
jgi:endo-1,4-beta-xylanase